MIPIAIDFAIKFLFSKKLIGDFFCYLKNSTILKFTKKKNFTYFPHIIINAILIPNAQIEGTQHLIKALKLTKKEMKI